MDEEKIVLDRRSFEALAVDSRVKILKSLKERRKTLSEMAKEQGMSVSGVKEHLETLESVGLIEKKDEGHKWKYYELTRKGADIVAPKELRVWILLSMSTIMLIAALTAIFSPPAVMAQVQDADAPAPEFGARAAAFEDTAYGDVAPGDAEAMADKEAGGLMAAAAFNDSQENAALNATPEAAESSGTQSAAGPDLTLPIAVAAVSAITLFACAGVLMRNRMGPTSL